MHWPLAEFSVMSVIPFVTVEEILITFTLAEDRTRDPPPKNPTPYHVAMKAGLYRKAVRVLYT